MQPTYWVWGYLLSVTNKSGDTLLKNIDILFLSTH